MVGFVVLGVIFHGLSVQVFERIWQNLLNRTSGLMTFRFILQPIMAMIVALNDGIKDARNGRNPYLWTILTDTTQRGSRLHEGLIATARVLLIGLCMDLIYQFILFDTFYPGEAIIITGLLAFLPYLLLRGPITRITRWWLDRRSANEVL
jgi:hypothetical protein